MSLAFEGFSSELVDGDGARVFVRRAGQGPPILLLHGFPQTHVMWRRVAPALAPANAVVCADLRGYGASDKPPSTSDHAPYSKRAMARDLVAMMQRLGHDRFTVAGHDRGGRVAYRLALDHPERVARLALFDIIPTSDAFDRADARFALAFWPWSLLAQPPPLPETLVAAAPAAIVEHALGEWGSDPDAFPPDVRDAYVAALSAPDAARAICEEYRAAATIDRDHDAEDKRRGRTIDVPVLALWSRGSALDTWYQDEGGPLGLLRRWAPRVEGRAIDGGHFFPEQNAPATIEALESFLA
jgi:haloacetate dehalogenase